MHSIPLFPPSGLVSEHEQICGQKLRMSYRMSVIFGHPVIATTRTLRLADRPKETEVLGTRMRPDHAQYAVSYTEINFRPHPVLIN